MKSFRKFTEERVKTLVATFGRFNPPHIGHEENIKGVSDLAHQAGADFKIYSSQSEDPKKNPLRYEEKVKFMRKMFPTYGRNIILDHDVKNMLDIATAAYKDGYTKFIVAVGSDRVDGFKAMIEKYNGVKSTHGYYKFPDGISVVSTGEREADVDDRTGKDTFEISASKMRSAAADGDLAAFSKGLPKSYKDGKELFNAVRKGMGLEILESVAHKNHIQSIPNNIRESYLFGQIFKVGDNINTIHTGPDILTILERGPNFVLCENKRTQTQQKYFINDCKPYQL